MQKEREETNDINDNKNNILSNSQNGDTDNISNRVYADKANKAIDMLEILKKKICDEEITESIFKAECEKIRSALFQTTRKEDDKNLRSFDREKGAKTLAKTSKDNVIDVQIS